MSEQILNMFLSWQCQSVRFQMSKEAACQITLAIHFIGNTWLVLLNMCALGSVSRVEVRSEEML